MRYINKLSKKIGQYKVLNNFILSIYKDLESKGRDAKSTCILYNNNLEIIYETEIDSAGGEIQIDESKFYYIERRSKLFSLEPKILRQELIHDGGDNFISSILGSDYILSDRSVFDSTNTRLNPLIKSFYTKSHKKWVNKDFGTIIINKQDNLFIYTNENAMEWNMGLFGRINYSTGEMEWQFNLNQNMNKITSEYNFEKNHQLVQFIGQYHDQLWFAMANEGMICIHAQTGEFLHHFRDIPVYTDFSGVPNIKAPVLPWCEKAIILGNEGKMVCLHTWYYWEMNLSTLEIEFKYLRPYFEKTGCFNYQQWKELIVIENQILIVSQTTRKIAAFNRERFEYDWIVDIPNDAGKPRSILVESGRVYVDTFNKELLVYEL